MSQHPGYSQESWPQPYTPPGGRGPAGRRQPPKRRRVWPWVLLGVILAFVLAFGACAALIGGAASQVKSLGGPAATVVYEVEGLGSANNISYSSNGAAGVAQDNGAKLPWRKELTFAEGSLRVATVTAQSGGSGDITCRIVVDGKAVAENKSSGKYAVVTCSSNAF